MPPKAVGVRPTAYACRSPMLTQTSDTDGSGPDLIDEVGAEIQVTLDRWSVGQIGWSEVFAAAIVFAAVAVVAWIMRRLVGRWTKDWEGPAAAAASLLGQVVSLGLYLLATAIALGLPGVHRRSGADDHCAHHRGVPLPPARRAEPQFGFRAPAPRSSPPTTAAPCTSPTTSSSKRRWSTTRRRVVDGAQPRLQVLFWHAPELGRRRCRPPQCWPHAGGPRSPRRGHPGRSVDRSYEPMWSAAEILSRHAEAVR